MELRDLRFFEAVAEARHLGHAAERVHRSQPALSMCISRLEEELGAPLFDRVGRRLVLTQVGAALLARARALRLTMDDTEREVRDLTTGVSGHVRLGASATATDFLLPELMRVLTQEAPAVTMQLVVRMNDALCVALRAGELDLALCPPTAETKPDLDLIRIASDPVVVVASHSHPLFARKAIRMVDLCDYKWILPAESAESRAWLNGAFVRRGLPAPVPQVESNSISSTPRLISRTQLLSFVSRHNLTVEPMASELREIPLRAVTMDRPLAVLWRAKGYLPPVARRVRSLLEKLGRQQTITGGRRLAKRRHTTRG
jgi:DNA-binding transcriptional LysR family regulator